MHPGLAKGKNLVEKELNNGDAKLPPREYKIAYGPVVTFSYIFLAAVYGVYLCFTKAKWQTMVFGFLLYAAAELGITAGAHRLWSHRSYKAKLPLEIILMLFNTLAFQNTAMYWVRVHRQHHKYVDSDGDPHSAGRGFFFSHIGWLLTRTSDEVIRGGKTIDMSDVYRNPVLRFQKKYAAPLITLICFVLPTVVPVYYWGETLTTAWFINMLRYAVNLNVSFLVNSLAHKYGYKPYDKNIRAVQNIPLTLMSLGDGFHNYHHVFPWDYRSSELGNTKLNFTAKFIEFFAWIGWAYDLKTVPDDLIKKRAEKTGDGSSIWGNYECMEESTKL